MQTKKMKQTIKVLSQCFMISDYIFKPKNLGSEKRGSWVIEIYPRATSSNVLYSATLNDIISKTGMMFYIDTVEVSEPSYRHISPRINIHT